jgi:hypothetical protein
LSERRLIGLYAILSVENLEFSFPFLGIHRMLHLARHQIAYCLNFTLERWDPGIMAKNVQRLRNTANI